MNDSRPTFGELLAHPKVQTFVSQDGVEKIAESLGKSEQASKEPIYIKILIGTGAWFAALFLLLFLGLSGIIESEGTAFPWGIFFLVAAIVISRLIKNIFTSQFSLALAFAGNVLILVGVDAANVGSHENIVAQALICAVAYPLFANSIFRFLAPIALVAFATAACLEDAPVLMHALIAGEMLLAGILLLIKKRPPFLTPMAYSAAAMLPATLLLLNLTQVNQWRTDFDEPLWPSSVMVAVGLIYLYIHLAGSSKRIREPWLILAIVSTIVLAILTTPAVLVAIALLLAGHAFGDRILSAFAYLFLPCSLVVFYYALNIDLAHKSWIIAGSGALLLVVRWVAGRLQPGEAAA